LLLASFLGTAVVRFSRYESIEASVRSVELLTEFLLAFGGLIGIFMIVFGPVTVDGFMATVSAQLDAIVAILISPIPLR